MKIANRINKIPPYPFVQISRTIAQKKSEGIDVISFGIGDPDIPTPDTVIESLTKGSLKNINHRYPESEGLPEFRLGVANWYSKRFGIELNPDNEIISLIGAKEGIGHISLALLNPDDIALIPDPGYPVYSIGTLFAAGQDYIMPLLKKNNWLPDLTEIPEEIARNPISFFSIAAIAFIGFLAPKVSFFFFGDAFKRVVVSTLIGLLVLALCLRIELAGDVNIFDFSWILTLIRAEGDVGAYSVTFCLSSFILLATWLRAAYHSSNGIELDTLPRFIVIPFALVAILLTISAVSDVGIATTWAGITYIVIVLLALAGAQLSRSGATLGDFRAGGVATGMLAFTVVLTVVLVVFAGFIFEILEILKAFDFRGVPRQYVPK